VRIGLHICDISLVRRVWLVVTFPNRTHSATNHFAPAGPRGGFLQGWWQWQCHIMRSSSRSVAIALAIQNVATADSWTLQSVSVNRPSLRTFSLQTGIVFFGFTQPSEQHITDRMETRLNNDCRGIFCFAIADRKLDQLS
jgi:hypothetical protein